MVEVALYQDNSCQRKEGCQRKPELRCGGGRGFDSPLSPFCVFPPLLSPPLFPFSSPLFFPSHLLDSPLSPFCVFGLVFVFCVFGGGGLWCGVWCGCGFAFGLGVMVFDVGVVWMGGSGLGPVWVRVCLAVCAFVRVSLLCCFGGEF